MNVEKLHKVKEVTVLVFGDFMVDKYIEGEVNRISPEAPVPVIEIKNKISNLGGAGNVINNIKSLGASVKVMGCIGDDSDGLWIKTKLNEMNINTNYLLQDKESMTIVKTRVVSRKQQFIRCDEEIVKEIPDAIQKKFNDDIDDILGNVDIVIISDYGKGSVNEFLSQLLIKSSKLRGISVIVDPKGKNYYKYKGATVCTPNTNELSIISNQKLNDEEDVINAGSKLCEDIELDYLLLTRSEKGMSLFKNGVNDKIDLKAITKDVSDVTGAGDTVVATLSLMIASKFEIEECCKIANIAASIVVSKYGTATLTLNELINAIVKTSEFKYITKDTAKYVIANLKEKNKKIVFTNGCYDLLHAGHLSSFINAKKFGDVLIVAVNSDESIKKIKGDLRPVINEADRIKMLCALECIDYVVLMVENNPVSLIKSIKPDIAVKGEDWKNKIIPEKDIIEKQGGKMEFIPLEEGLSTTNIIDRIIKAYK